MYLLNVEAFALKALAQIDHLLRYKSDHLSLECLAVEYLSEMETCLEAFEAPWEMADVSYLGWQSLGRIEVELFAADGVVWA